MKVNKISRFEGIELKKPVRKDTVLVTFTEYLVSDLYDNIDLINVIPGPSSSTESLKDRIINKIRGMDVKTVVFLNVCPRVIEAVVDELDLFYGIDTITYLELI